MEKRFRKLLNKVRSYWYGLFWGLKETNDDVFTQSGIHNTSGTEINQQINENRLSNDLLKGEVTKQVEELRYRTYKVDREAKNYEFFSPLKAIKFDKQDSKFVNYDKSDGLELITIQPNECQTADVWDAIKDVDFKKEGYTDNKDEYHLDVGRFDIDNDYTIKVERDFMPRFKIEKFTTRLVVKKLDEKDGVVLEFYVDKYPKDSLKSIYFIKEIERMLQKYEKSDIVDLTRVSFITSHAFGKEDMLQYKFDHIYYRGIREYDGHYIISFRGHMFVNGQDLTKQYYSKSMDDKYKNHEKKEVVADLSGGYRHQTFQCEECGKIVEYDTDMIDNATSTQPRDILDENTEDTGILSYMDLQMAEQTYGKKLCKDCLIKYINKGAKTIKHE